jgi:hypothetical protein
MNNTGVLRAVDHDFLYRSSRPPEMVIAIQSAISSTTREKICKGTPFSRYERRMVPVFTRANNSGMFVECKCDFRLIGQTCTFQNNFRAELSHQKNFMFYLNLLRTLESSLISTNTFNSQSIFSGGPTTFISCSSNTFTISACVGGVVHASVA